MHGQRRDEYKARLRDDATATKLATKATQWHILSSELLKQRKVISMPPLPWTNETAQTANKTNVETLKLIDKLVSVNPDPIYLWNHRRDILMLQLESTSSTPIDSSTFIQQEQLVTQNALQRNPKAYGAWFHRKWSIRTYILITMNHDVNQTSTTTNDKTVIYVLKGELELCKEFLKLDERNFHCWNYRRFIVAMLANVTCSTDTRSASKNNDNGVLSKLDGGWHFLLSIFKDDDSNEQDVIIGSQLALKNVDKNTSADTTSNNKFQLNRNCMENIQEILEKEWTFTTEKIQQNFSNGSAFHYRSKLLPLLYYIHSRKQSFCTSDGSSSATCSTVKIKSDWIQEELELIRNAIFTEPDDQTSWWYFRFILSWSNPINNVTTINDTDQYSMDEYKQIMYDEWSSIQELVDSEERQCKWGLLGLYMVAMIFVDLENKHNVVGSMHYQGEDWLELAKSYLEELKVLDPDRINRYESMECDLA
jgi:geranylgeranyl transferase type-2 subunit alpha